MKFVITILGLVFITLTYLGQAFAEVVVIDESRENLTIGDSWGRRPVQNPLDLPNTQFWPLAASVGEFNFGTAFYVGRHFGKHLFLTNAHVALGVEFHKRALSGDGEFSDQACLDTSGERRKVRLKLLNLSFECSRLIYFNFNSEIALLEFEIPEGVSSQMNRLGISLFDQISLVEGQPLFQLGFGGMFNPNLDILLSRDEDCRIFGDTSRWIKDADSSLDIYSVFSRAMGCEVVAGDSGSPVFDLKTGVLVGISWSGRLIKNQMLRDTQYLRDPSFRNDPLLWTDMNYFVPAYHIRNEIVLFLERPKQ